MTTIMSTRIPLLLLSVLTVSGAAAARAKYGGTLSALVPPQQARRWRKQPSPSSPTKATSTTRISCALPSVLSRMSPPASPSSPRGGTGNVLRAAADASYASDEPSSPSRSNRKFSQGKFDLDTAVFCAGLAFDAYAEPPPTSSRWERGSSGLKVAFLSQTFTRSLYKGIVEVTPLRATDLPDEDDAAESLLSGGGVDASLLVAVVEGAWTEDVQKLEKETYHGGVFELAGCAHVGRSTTAWSNVNEAQAKKKKARGENGAYHIESSWGRPGQAVWEDDPPFYLYVREPKDARLVFTLHDEDVVGGGESIGSAFRKLSDLLPSAATGGDDAVSMIKKKVIDQLKKGGKLKDAIKITTNEDGTETVDVDPDYIMSAINDAYGSEVKSKLKMTSKPPKKDKGGQRMAGMVAGAMVGGPAGAAVGGIIGSLYEGQVRGSVEVKLRYTPVPQGDVVTNSRVEYEVKGGLPGVDWGEMYARHLTRAVPGLGEGGNAGESETTAAKEETATASDAVPPSDLRLAGSDLEFCCFVTHDSTGCSCGIYRSLERKLIAVSFRGTCAPVDLITDASIAQLAWVEGEDVEKKETIKIHSGFRNSLDSISRRLKELMLAAVPPGEDLSQYDVIVTGHSLGGALATSFTLDVAEYGMDAGRGLPQLEPSDDWWSGLASTFGGNKKKGSGAGGPSPPRPKTLRMYNFGSPRVGNDIFCAKFDSFIGNGIDEAYRIVNDQDVVARFPRSVNALAFGSISYDHCGPTVQITELASQISKRRAGGSDGSGGAVLWIEGESDDADCTVRDNNARIDKEFTQREVKVFQSIFSGAGLSHHMEDKYYQGMGMCCGYAALVGQELKPLDELEEELSGMELADVEEVINAGAV